MAEWRAAARLLYLVPTIFIQWLVIRRNSVGNLQLLIDICVGSLADENYGFLLANNSYTNYLFNSLTNHLPKLPLNPNSNFLNNKTFPQMEKHCPWGPTPPSKHAKVCCFNLGMGISWASKFDFFFTCLVAGKIWENDGSWVLSSNPNLVPEKAKGKENSRF